MHDLPDLSSIQTALNEAEAELQQLGGDLQFLVSPVGKVEIVRRRRTTDPVEPLRRIDRLEGCDPLMWRVAHRQGDVTLGAPYRDSTPRCVVGGEPITRGAALELYLRGRPVCARHVRSLAPLPALVHGLLAAGGHLLDALGQSAARLEEIDNTELREIVATKLARELADRLLARVGGWVSDETGSTRPTVEDPSGVA